jgi:hypothetical protein
MWSSSFFQNRTLALVLLAISHILKPNRSRAASSAKGPQVLVLLPNATLLHQVETWLKEFLPPSLVAKEGQEITRTIFPNDRDNAERIEQIPRIVLSTPSALWAGINPDAIRPLGAASSITKQPISENWLTSASLARSLELVMVDEPDDVLSPLPGRFDKPRRNARGVQEDRWGKHVPIGVKLLRTLLPGRSVEGDERQARNKRVQTVWTSATLNSRVRAWVTMEGWARPAGEGGLVLDFTKNTGDRTTGEGNIVAGEDAQQASQREVDHVCLVVDPLTGKARDMNDSEPEEIRSVPSAVESDSPTAFDEGKGDVHPLLLEALALDWATSTGSGSSGGESLVLPPSGTSIPRLQAQLAELDCPSVSLDVDSKETAADLGKDFDEGVDEAKEGRLLILPRSHIRGIDIPNVRTVYILAGLGVGSKRGPSTAGLWAERERDYQHWAGRMGRLSRSSHDQNQGKDGKGKVVSIVMQGEEERAMQKLLESRRLPHA